jgi:carboxymethylenebutenolidase
MERCLERLIGLVAKLGTYSICTAWLACAACSSDDGAPAAAVPEAAVARATQAAAAAADSSIVAVVSSDEPRVPVIEEELAYGEAADRNLIGYLAMPADAVEPPPGVLVVHDAAGLDEHIRALTRRLAGEGFVVLAVDLYGGKTAHTPEELKTLQAEVTAAPQAALANLRQGYEYLSRYALAPKVGDLGLSFGGTWALQAGIGEGAELDAVVTYYGQVLRNDDLIETLDVPLLGLYGAEDRAIPVADVQAFRVALSRLGKDAEIHIYSSVGHAFADPDAPSYAADTAEDAWQRTVEFLNRALR